MPTILYSRVPAAAVRIEIDGNSYAHIPHKLAPNASHVIENHAAPRMVRFSGPSFIRDGEAYVYFARLGDAVPVPSVLPFAVTAERRDAFGRIV